MAELSDKAIQAVTQLARMTGEPKIIEHGNIPFAVIPSDAQIQSLEKYVFNEHAATPERIRQNVTVLDPESFIGYYSLFADANSRVFAFEPKIEVAAILDYHGALSEGSPRWCQHRLTLTLRQSEEWKTWVGRNNNQFTQMAFAEFLEQNAIDIVRPAPAHMTDVARELEATTEVEFGAGSRTQDGQVRFKYTETTKATVGAGKLDVPERFTISLPVFVGGPRISMDALLRFRVNGGKLVLWYTLIRPEEVMRTAFIAARNVIAEKLGVDVINGQA